MPWGQLLLVFTVPVSAMVGILGFAPLLPLIREEFGLSNTWAGMLASATILSHTLLQLPGAYIADRIGVKRAIAVGMGVMALGLLASAIAPNIESLLLFRFVTGIGTAIVFITALAFVNSIAPISGRSLAQGLYGASANAGVLLVMLFSGWLAILAGWRGSFLVEGLFLVGIAVLLITYLRSDTSFSHSASASWGETLRHRHLYVLGLGHIVTYGAFTGVSAWAVTFLLDKYGFGLEWAGILSAFLPASSIPGRIWGGRISVGHERQVVVLGCLATAVGIGLLPLLDSPVLAVADLALVGWFAAMPFGAVFSYGSLVTGERASGRDLSLINFVGNVGALLFPPAVGYAVDLGGSFVPGFGFVAVAGVIASVVVALWLPPPRER